jgi:hypothetical protein
MSDKDIENVLSRLQKSALDRLQGVEKDIPKTYDVFKVKLTHQHSKDALRKRVEGAEKLDGEANRHLSDSDSLLGKEAISHEARKQHLIRKAEIAIKKVDVLGQIEHRPPTKLAKTAEIASKTLRLPGIPNPFKGFLRGDK